MPIDVVIEMLLALERQPALADRLEHALGDPLGGLAVGVAQHDGELVAAEAGDDVGLAHALAQRAADGADDLVAGLVAARVVDVLEAVEVEQEQRAAAAVAGGVADELGQLLVEAAAVEQVGQRVVVGQVLELGLEALALRDVADDRGQHGALVGLQRADGDVDRELGAVLALAPQLEAHAERDLRVARLALQHGGEAGADQRARALGEQLLDRTADDLLALVAEQLVGAGVGGAMVPSGATSTIGSGALSTTALSLSAAAWRSEMSRIRPLKKRAPPVSHMPSESSSGNSRPFLRRPTTSTVLPIRRVSPPAAARAMPGVVHRAEALGYQDRERLAQDLVLDVAEHQLGAEVPGDDLAGLVGGHDRGVVRRGDGAEAAVGLAQRLRQLQAGDDAAELAADVGGDVEQARVRRDGLEREALDDGEDLVVDRHREGERAAQAAGSGRLGAREVRVLGDVDDPGRAAGGRDAAREARRQARTPSARSARGRRRSGSRARSAQTCEAERLVLPAR